MFTFVSKIIGQLSIYICTRFALHVLDFVFWINNLILLKSVAQLVTGGMSTRCFYLLLYISAIRTVLLIRYSTENWWEIKFNYFSKKALAKCQYLATCFKQDCTISTDYWELWLSFLLFASWQNQSLLLFTFPCFICCQYFRRYIHSFYCYCTKFVRTRHLTIKV